MLIFLKNPLDFLKDSIFQCFFKEYNRRLRCFFKNNSLQHIIMERLNLEEENIIKDARNLFRLKKNLHTIKDVRNQEKETKAIKNHFEHEEENYYKAISTKSLE